LESEAKLSSFSRERLDLGFPSEAFIFSELRGKEVSFTAKVLAVDGDGWIADV
jgi:hypothetical protein